MPEFVGFPDKECAGCGDEITGNCKVVDGERYCFDCRDPLHECARGTTDVDAPESIEEYNARRATVVGTSALMNGGDPR